MYMLNFLIHYTALYHIVSQLENIFEKTSTLQDREKKEHTVKSCFSESYHLE